MGAAIALQPFVPRISGLLKKVRLSRAHKRALQSVTDELHRLYARLEELDELIFNGGQVALWREATDLKRIKRTEDACKQAEEALAETRTELARVMRVTILGELAASIAHEVNQPLSAVIINSSVCQRWLTAEPPNIPEAVEAAGRIIQDANRASEITAHIRAFLKRGETLRTRLDVNDLLHEILGFAEGAACTHGVSVQVASTPDLPQVWGDRVQLQQVVLNLMINAIEAMSAVAGRSRILHVGTECNRSDDAVRVVVRDSGVGLDLQQRDRVFDAFYTTKAAGMGMGLAISRSIVQAHGGRLWATANDGPGETFQFTLPVAAPEAS